MQHACQPVRAQRAHLLRKRLRDARQRQAHLPQSAQPLLLAHASAQCQAAQAPARHAHCAERSGDVSLAWTKQACLWLPALCDDQAEARQQGHACTAGSIQVHACLVAGPRITVLCSARTPAAAHVTFCPQAQALLRHRQDAVAEQGQPALLDTWAEPRNLAPSLTHSGSDWRDWPLEAACRCTYHAHR